MSKISADVKKRIRVFLKPTESTSRLTEIDAGKEDARGSVNMTQAQLMNLVNKQVKNQINQQKQQARANAAAAVRLLRFQIYKLFSVIVIVCAEKEINCTAS